ncbi:hypothetical protein [Achromobacter xylosoxidans]|uniref:hypothetical protein n=1 Tax=Alcaligenes xylosoxydans xylosoxydans TaxID=85698 RepID=UPI00292399E0|nr:hypothetical protein [Achromobacter xylosoxidans]BEG78428.1 hypothetical protein HBIAX_05530 [Achromobacter xylosoxidans]
MTQQDDITQRLRDNADIDEAEHGNARVVQLEREAADEIERLRAELSTLRAPVADEQDRNATISQVVGLCNRIPGATTWNAAQFMYDEMHRRATLASAPVAVEHPDGLRTLLAELPGMRDDPKKGDAVFRCGVNGALDVVADRIRELLRSAPVAGEAKNYPGENVAERLDNMADDQPPGSQAQSDLYAAATIWRKHIAHRAAPQASAENVRNAALEEAAHLMEQTGKRIAASDIRALKTQADKDGGGDA